MDGIQTGVRRQDGMVTGVQVEIDHEQLAHVNSLLRSEPKKALMVYRRAIGRGLKAGRVEANKQIKTRYAISDANLNNIGGHTYKTYKETIREDASGVVGFINFAGAKIPLYRFTVKPNQRLYTTRYVNGRGGWRVTTTIYAADIRGAMLKRGAGFIATFPSGHIGIFKRTGETTKNGKPQIEEYWGYSVRDMLDYQPAREAVQERMAEVIQKRIDHELLRTLGE